MMLCEKLRDCLHHPKELCVTAHKAADTIEELVEVLRETSLMCDLYAQFIRDHVRVADLELHPYLPELECLVLGADALLAKIGGAE